jgi:hypothetical protein
MLRPLAITKGRSSSVAGRTRRGIDRQRAALIHDVSCPGLLIIILYYHSIFATAFPLVLVVTGKSVAFDKSR